MKKLFLAALAGLVLIPGSALAADLPAPVYKAPAAAAPAFNWSGVYINAGGGYGMWNADSQVLTAAGACLACVTRSYGGGGYLGEVGGGFDMQLGTLGLGHWNPTIVAGLFGDYDFSSIRGTIDDPFNFISARIKDTDAWYAGARLGVALGSLLYTYTDGGVTGHHFGGTGMVFDNGVGGPTGITTAAFNKTGWFLGGGTETSLSGLLWQGMFLRTEYRYSYLGTANIAEIGQVPATNITYHPTVQTLTTSLVYKFNWMGR